MENGGVLKVQPVRQRKIYSCIACHSKKIKCSKDHPTCLRCAKIGIECRYYINERVSRRASPSEPGSKVVKLRGRKAASDKTAVDKTANSKIKGRSAKQNKISKQEEREHLVTGTEEEVLEENTPQRFEDDPAINSNKSQASSDPDAAILSQTATPSPASTIEPLVDQVSTNTSSSNNSINSSVSFSNKQISIPPTLKKLRLFNLIIDSIPVKSHSDNLLKIYKGKVHFFIPLLDLAEFEGQYHYFWDYYLAHQLRGSRDLEWVAAIFNNKLDFFLTYYIILFGAAINADSNDDELLKYSKIICKIFKYLKFPRLSANYSLKYLQLFTLYQSLIPIPSVVDVAALIRTAQLFKLDRDPVIYHKLADVDLVQFKRILWWQIVYLDMRSSLLNNVLPMICLNVFDTSLPNELDSNKNLLINVVVINSKYRFCALMNEILNSNIDNIRQKIIDLHVRCNGSILALRDHLKNSTYLNDESTKFLNFVIADLKLIPDKALFLLYKRLFQQSSYMFPISTKLNRYHGIYFNYNDFNIDTNNINVTFLHLLIQFIHINDEFADHVCITWSMESHLIIHLIIIILFNLIVELKSLTHSSANSVNSNNTNLSTIIIDFLHKDIKFNLLNHIQPMLIKQLQTKSPKLSFWQKSIVLITSISKIIKIYPLKFVKNYQGSVEDFITINNLDSFQKNLVTFVEPYVSNDFGASSSISPTNAQLGDTNNHSNINSLRGNSANNDNSNKSNTTNNLENKNATSPELTLKDPNTTSCAAIAPRSMTALAAATTVARIEMFDPPMEIANDDDIDDPMNGGEPDNSGSIFGNSYEDDLPSIIPDGDQQQQQQQQRNLDADTDVGQEASQVPSHQDGNGNGDGNNINNNNNSKQNSDSVLDSINVEGMTYFEIKKQKIIEGAFESVNDIDNKEDIDFEVSNEYIDLLVMELQKLLSYL